MSTYHPKSGDITRQWYVIDATDVVLGKLASTAADILRGKHKPQFAPNVDTGDHVIVINADKIHISSNKRDREMRYRHSGYPGGLKSQSYAELLDKDPTRAVEKAIRGMLPKNSLGRAQIKKLKVYAGPEHPHHAQKAQPFEIKQISQ